MGLFSRIRRRKNTSDEDREQRERDAYDQQSQWEEVDEPENAAALAALPTPDDIEDLLDEPLDAQAQQETPYNSQTRYVDLQVSQPCGFGFSGVVEGFSTRAARAQAQEGTADHSVYAAGANFGKIVGDIELVRPLFAALESNGMKTGSGIQFPPSAPMLELLRPFGEKGSHVRGMANLAVITAHARDEQGRSPRFPVSVRAVTVQRGVAEAATDGGIQPVLESMVLDLSYEPSGRAAQGRLVRWHRRDGYACDFEWDPARQKYEPTDVRYTTSPGSWQHIRLARRSR